MHARVHARRCPTNAGGQSPTCSCCRWASIRSYRIIIVMSAYTCLKSRMCPNSDACSENKSSHESVSQPGKKTQTQHNSQPRRSIHQSMQPTNQPGQPTNQPNKQTNKNTGPRPSSHQSVRPSGGRGRSRGRSPVGANASQGVPNTPPNQPGSHPRST